VDTHRPKPTLKKKLDNVDHKNAGASGEIINGKSPILPINPTLWPSTSATTNGTH
jgi:hypothetical protein